MENLYEIYSRSNCIGEMEDGAPEKISQRGRGVEEGIKRYPQSGRGEIRKPCCRRPSTRESLWHRRTGGGSSSTKIGRYPCRDTARVCCDEKTESARQEFDGLVGAGGGIGGVAVGSDGVAEALSDGSAADHDFHLIPQTLFLRQLHDVFHLAHGGGQ